MKMFHSLFVLVLLSSLALTDCFSVPPSSKRSHQLFLSDTVKTSTIQSEVREKKRNKAFLPDTENVSKIQSRKAPIAAVESTIVDLAIAGALAAVVGDVVLHPIDCIKTIQQSDAGFGLNLVDASKYIWKNFGIQGFYSGLAPYLAGDSIGSAVKLCTYENLKSWFAENVSKENMGLAIFLCAGLSFLVASAVIIPGELIKQRMQMGQMDSILDGIKSIYEADGIAGFYVGFVPLLMRDVPYTMLELGVYDTLKKFLFQTKNKDEKNNNEVDGLTQLDEILAAAVTGGVAGYFTTPFDTIKTKIMVDDQMVYAGFADCIVQTINDHGLDSMMQGGLARIAWLVPFTAIYLPCNDLIKRELQRIRGQKKI